MQYSRSALFLIFYLNATQVGTSICISKEEIDESARGKFFAACIRNDLSKRQLQKISGLDNCLYFEIQFWKPLGCELGNDQPRRKKCFSICRGPIIGFYTILSIAVIIFVLILCYIVRKCCCRKK